MDTKRLLMKAGVVLTLASATTAWAATDNEGTHFIKYGDKIGRAHV